MLYFIGTLAQFGVGFGVVATAASSPRWISFDLIRGHCCQAKARGDLPVVILWWQSASTCRFIACLMVFDCARRFEVAVTHPGVRRSSRELGCGCVALCFTRCRALYLYNDYCWVAGGDI